MSNPGPVLSAGKFGRVGDAYPIVNMRSTLLGWFRPITIGRTKQSVGGDGLVNLVSYEIQTSGVLQPMDERLERKAEGGRSWSYWELHCVPNLALATNDTITIKGSQYTVMGKKDYTDNGFVIYYLTKKEQSHG